MTRKTNNKTVETTAFTKAQWYGTSRRNSRRTRAEASLRDSIAELDAEYMDDAYRLNLQNESNVRKNNSQRKP